MALVQGYSSGEDDVHEITANPFGIAQSTANPAKRIKLDPKQVAVEAAPHVLSEVSYIYHKMDTDTNF